MDFNEAIISQTEEFSPKGLLSIGDNTVRTTKDPTKPQIEQTYFVSKVTTNQNLGGSML
jgi:hypothetical protein